MKSSAGESEESNEVVISLPVNYEGNEQVLEMIAAAPCAIPMPSRIMMEKKLRVGDIPAGLLLNRYSGDLDVRIGSLDTSGPGKLELRTVASSTTTPPRERVRDFDLSKIKAFTPNSGVTEKVPGSKDVSAEDRVSLIRAPRTETNLGKNPDSRRYVRGVLHTHPLSLRFGAIVTLLLVVVLPAAFFSAFLLLLSREVPVHFEWVPKWLLAFPIAFPVVGIAYLISATSSRCRICNQRLFLHKSALKHVKAHRIWGLGYIIPLCLHLLLFRWFRCSSCGTPVRLIK